MLTTLPGSNSRRFIDYIDPMVGDMRYFFWRGGIVGDGHGPYAYNGPAPQHSYLRQNPIIFCAGVSNLAVRLAGKRIPIAQHQSALYDGGIAAYFGSPMLPQIGAGYFAGYMRPFNIGKVLAEAKRTRQIQLCGWKYTGTAIGSQGHVFLVFPSGWILESTPSRGLAWTWWKGSYAVANATIWVHSTDWLEYKGDRIHQGGVWR